MGIDQSFTSSGITILDEDLNMLFCEVFTSNKQLTPYHRINEIRNRIEQIAIDYNPDYIAIEGLAFNRIGNATRNLAGLLHTIVDRLHFQLNYSVLIIPPRTMKITFTGNGKASKQEILENVPKPLLTNLTEERKILKTKGLYDVADSIGLAYTAFQCLSDPALLDKIHNLQ